MSHQGGQNPDDWLTIAEAARRIGVSERSLRRALTQENAGSEQRQVTRPTKTGHRQITLLSPVLCQRLQEKFERWETPADTGKENAAQTQANSGNAGGTAAENTGSLVVVYERLIQEQQARIADLQTALEHEREQTTRLQEALSREQTLRALMLPPPPGPQGSSGEAQEVQTGRQPSEPTGQGGEVRRSPWWRFWQRKEGG